jgi:hypothetical protein
MPAAASKARLKFAVRHLAGVVESPTLRPDGTVLQEAGYDESTGLLYRPSAHYPPLPQCPTREHARQAAGLLLSLVDEFPFVAGHQTVWLAAILTMLGKPAVNGPCPMFLFEAPSPGSGKTLLAELVGLITTGREAPVSELPGDNEEVRKAIASILLEGERVVLFDNATGTFGCQALDAALTGTTYKARILGKTERTPELTIDTVFMATGNNVSLRGDTPRRVIPCRIVPTDEDPAQRKDFRIPDLKAHVRQHRPELVVAALTILLAHAQAGRPAADLVPFGSFEAWSTVVRQAVHWATDIDPNDARGEMTVDVRTGNDTLATVLAGWSRLPGGQDRNDGVSARRALEFASMASAFGGDPPHVELRDALLEWGKDGQLPDPATLGYRLRSAKDRVAGGWILRCFRGHGKQVKWWTQPQVRG